MVGQRDVELDETSVKKLVRPPYYRTFLGGFALMFVIFCVVGWLAWTERIGVPKYSTLELVQGGAYGYDSFRSCEGAFRNEGFWLSSGSYQVVRVRYAKDGRCARVWTLDHSRKCWVFLVGGGEMHLVE